jgi:hypothetical protein
MVTTYRTNCVRGRSVPETLMGAVILLLNILNMEDVLLLCKCGRRD